MTVTFKDLKAHYPKKSRPELFADLGGQWPGLVNDPNYQNTCAIRLSVAILGAGGTIPRKYREGIAGDERSLIIKVKTMGSYVNDVFGKWYWGISKNPGTPINSGVVPKRTGIIAYHADWIDASGHFDLWTGTAFVGKGSFDQILDGFDIMLWAVD